MDYIQNNQWTHATFLAIEGEIELLLQSNQITEAVDKAEKLQRQSLKAGDTTYLEAPQDIAKSYLLLGQALQKYGSAQLALQPLSESQRRFAILASWGGADYANLLIKAISLQGNCLRDLGRLKEAATAYEQAIHYASSSDNLSAAANNIVELATTYQQMGYLDDALHEYQNALVLIRQLNNREMIATILQQMGIAYMESEQLGQAQKAFVEAWNLSEDMNDEVLSADILTELGNLWNIEGGFVEAIDFYRQAVAVYVKLGRTPQEGAIRSNIADALIKLGNFDDAKSELARAIECESPLGHAAEPWKTWNIMHRLQLATGNKSEQVDAHIRATSSYAAYRKAGGTSQSAWNPLYTLVLDAIQLNNQESAKSVLRNLLRRDDLSASDKSCIYTLQKILNGNYSLRLTDNTKLSYLDTVELRLLIESLAQ